MTETKKKTGLYQIATVLFFMVLMMAVLPYHATAAQTDDTKATVTFTAGELKLESVPVLDFGSNEISREEQNYPAVTVAPDVQVSDLRGSGIGWDLQVSLSPFVLEDTSTPTLNAASIRFTSPTVSPVNNTMGAAPKAVQDVKLTSDNTLTPVLQAEDGEGMGVWSLAWTKENTTLNVKPGTAQPGKSAATLTWSLQSTP